MISIGSIANPALEWLSTHPQWAGIAVFLISAAESIAIIGTIVPGTVVMTAIGILIGSGIIPFWPAMLCAILGAIMGDGVSYWIGFYFNQRLEKVWPFRKHPTLLKTGQAFFYKYGGMSVFIGRFVGPVRALVPLVAGMLNFNPWRFMIANITSAIGWAPAYLLPGILIGAVSTELPSGLATRFILVTVFYALGLIFCLWLIAKILILVQKEVEECLAWIWQSLDRSRFFSFITSILKHSNAAHRHGQLTLGVYFLLVSFGFLGFMYHVQQVGPQGMDINELTWHFFRSIRTPSLDNVMLCISFLGDKYVLLPIFLTVFICLLKKKRSYAALHVLGLGLLSASAIEIAKLLTHIKRPWGVLDQTATGVYSFPSGHTTLAVIFYIGAALFIVRLWQIDRFRYIVYTIAGLLVTAIALSRLYFTVHWLTDIIGSLLLGTAILMFLILSYRRNPEKTIRSKGLILTALLTFAITYAAACVLQFKHFQKDYTLLERPEQPVTLHDWWEQKGRYFPIYQINRLGLSSQTFDVQWLGDIKQIKTLLLKNGWKIAPSFSFVDAIYRITGLESAEHLPLIQPIYLDKTPTLVLISHEPDKKLLILRFWKPRTQIIGSHSTLWVGSIEYVPSTYSWLFRHKRIKPITLTSSILFTKPLGRKYQIKQMTVTLDIKKNLSSQPIILIRPRP